VTKLRANISELEEKSLINREDRRQDNAQLRNQIGLIDMRETVRRDPTEKRILKKSISHLSTTRAQEASATLPAPPIDLYELIERARVLKSARQTKWIEK
jgi:hypothetical protein